MFNFLYISLLPPCTVCPLPMPRSSRRRRPASSAPRIQCTALLPDEITVCNNLVATSDTRCSQHGKEYAKLTKGYKQHSQLVDALDSSASVISRAMNDIQSSEEAQQKLRVLDEFVDVLTLEIGARKTHHRRFFRDGDCLLFGMFCLS